MSAKKVAMSLSSGDTPSVSRTAQRVQLLHHIIDTNVDFANDPERLKQQFKLAIQALTQHSEETYLVALELAHGRPLPYWF